MGFFNPRKNLNSSSASNTSSTREVDSRSRRTRDFQIRKLERTASEIQKDVKLILKELNRKKSRAINENQKVRRDKTPVDKPRSTTTKLPPPSVKRKQARDFYPRNKKTTIKKVQDDFKQNQQKKKKTKRKSADGGYQVLKVSRLSDILDFTAAPKGVFIYLPSRTELDRLTKRKRRSIDRATPIFNNVRLDESMPPSCSCQTVGPGLIIGKSRKARQTRPKRRKNMKTNLSKGCWRKSCSSTSYSY